MKIELAYFLLLSFYISLEMLFIITNVDTIENGLIGIATFNVFLLVLLFLVKCTEDKQ